MAHAEIFHTDRGQFSTPGPVHATGQPSGNTRWWQDLEGAALPDSVTPGVGTAAPDQTFKLRDSVIVI